MDGKSLECLLGVQWRRATLAAKFFKCALSAENILACIGREKEGREARDMGESKSVAQRAVRVHGHLLHNGHNRNFAKELETINKMKHVIATVKYSSREL